MFDPVENPVHYAGNGVIPCMDALESMMCNAEVSAPEAYWWGCVFKYLWRWPLKNGLQDLRKARQCLDYLIDVVESEL